MIYPHRCKACSHRWDHVCKYTELPNVVCPACGSLEVDQDCAAKIKTVICSVRKNKMDGLEKDTSVVHFHPEKDVGRMREELGTRAGSCITDRGDVRFHTKQDQAAYLNAKRDYERRRRQKAEDNELFEREQVKKGNMVEVYEPVGGSLPENITPPVIKPKRDARKLMERHLTRKKKRA